MRDLESADSAAPLEALLCKMPGVLTASVAYAAERLVVELDTEKIKPDAIVQRVKELGYERYLSQQIRDDK